MRNRIMVWASLLVLKVILFIGTYSQESIASDPLSSVNDFPLELKNCLNHQNSFSSCYNHISLKRKKRDALSPTSLQPKYKENREVLPTTAEFISSTREEKQLEGIHYAPIPNHGDAKFTSIEERESNNNHQGSYSSSSSKPTQDTAYQGSSHGPSAFILKGKATQDHKGKYGGDPVRESHVQHKHKSEYQTSHFGGFGGGGSAHAHKGALTYKGKISPKGKGGYKPQVHKRPPPSKFSFPNLGFNKAPPKRKPVRRPQPHTRPKGYRPPQKGYKGPPPKGHTPQKGYRPPQKAHKRPQKGYGPPQKAHKRPQKGYGPPPKVHQSPQKGYGPPPKVHQSPQKGYGPPPKVHQSPQKGYGPPPKVHQSPQKGYGPPPKVHQSPQNGYGLPPKGHHQPSVSYSTPSKAHAQPSTGYDSPTKEHASVQNEYKQPTKKHPSHPNEYAHVQSTYTLSSNPHETHQQAPHQTHQPVTSSSYSDRSELGYVRPIITKGQHISGDSIITPQKENQVHVHYFEPIDINNKNLFKRRLTFDRDPILGIRNPRYHSSKTVLPKAYNTYDATSDSVSKLSDSSRAPDRLDYIRKMTLNPESMIAPDVHESSKALAYQNTRTNDNANSNEFPHFSDVFGHFDRILSEESFS